MNSVLKKLTESIVSVDKKKENKKLVDKWEQTCLLEGLSGRTKENMAILLENQAKQVLKEARRSLHEASSMSGGDVEGFAAVAFPIVRRVFGELVANDLVSVQPMSLPNSLIFFLDYTYTDAMANAGAVAGESIYGGGVVGQQITGGVSLGGSGGSTGLWDEEKGFYGLNNSYSSPTGSAAATMTLLAARSGSGVWYAWGGGKGDPNYTPLSGALIGHDPSLSGSQVAVYKISKASLTTLDTDNLSAIHTTTGSGAAWKMVRRLTKFDPFTGSAQLNVVFATDGSGSVDATARPQEAEAGNGVSFTFTYPKKDAFTTGTGTGAVVGTAPWGLEFDGAASGLQDDIREIDIKIDSISVEAKSKKLKAKWTPELSEDINAYHSLDAEVELTSILSEHIEMEIDREILVDLINKGTAGTYYWSRRPGKFVNKDYNGADITSNGAVLPDFTGTVSQWYETLIETINDLSAQIHRKTLQGGASFLVTSPEVASILEMTAGFRASVTVDDARGDVSVVNVGQVSKKWDVYVDPYFPRNGILVGRKGKSFLQSGYVYAPYIPLQISPTIFDTETFTPRKAVRTRYAKQMVRPDMYGMVVVVDLNG